MLELALRKNNAVAAAIGVTAESRLDLDIKLARHNKHVNAVKLGGVSAPGTKDDSSPRSIKVEAKSILHKSRRDRNKN